MPSSSVSNWNAKDVLSWLSEKHYSETVINKFKQNDIDGIALLDLNAQDAAFLCETLGSQKKLLQDIEKLRKNYSITIYLTQEEENANTLIMDTDSFNYIVGSSSLLTQICAKWKDKQMLKQNENGIELSLLNAEADPITTEDEYLVLVEALVILEKHCWKTTSLLEDEISSTIKSEQLRTISKSSKSLQRFMERVIQHRIDETKKQNVKLPRFVRACEKFELSAKEIRALQFILMANTAREFPPNFASQFGSHSDQRSMIFFMSKFASLTTQQLLQFVRADRIHMKQGLFETDDEYSTIWNSQFLVMPQPVLLGLTGCQLTLDEFFKIDKTILAEIVSQDQPELASVTDTEPHVKKAKTKKILDDEARLVNLTDNLSQDMDDELKALMQEVGLEDESTSQELDGVQEETEENLENGETALDEVTSDETTKVSSPTATDIKPYENDLEYLEDEFSVIETQIKIRKMELDGNDDTALLLSRDKRKPEAVIRELKAKKRTLQGKLDARLKVTLSQGIWLPRLERLAQLKNIDQFEKKVLLCLVGGMISQTIRQHTGDRTTQLFKSSFDVNSLLALFCESLQEQIKSRSYFYKNSHLVKEGIIKINTPPFRSSSELGDCIVEMDRRLLDYILGLNTELSELVDGSDLFTPSIKLENVVLPSTKKNLILDTIKNFDVFKSYCQQIGLTDQLSYGTGVCMLFYGPSGTGKTMTAHGVANELDKKLLLVNMNATLQDAQNTKEMLRFIFREAVLHNAIIFFDECEALFEDRNMKASPVTLLLTELEKYQGIIILATNRAFDLDEALYRRINLAIEFVVPDFELRQQIWTQHLPPAVKLDSEVDIKQIAMNYEITGGFIKNAVLSALSFAIARDSENIILKHADLERGATLQLRGHLQISDKEKDSKTGSRSIAPNRGLSDMVLESHTLKQLQEIIHFEKARKILYAHWGFDDPLQQQLSSIALFVGDPGTGKTTAARAIGYEIGKSIKELNASDFLSRFVGGTAKNVDAVFKEAKETESVMLIENVEDLFGYQPNRTAQQQTEINGLLYTMNRFNGIVILTAQSAERLDLSLLTNLKFNITFSSPNEQSREQLWKRLLPSKAPQSVSEQQLKKLAVEYDLNGRSIFNAITVGAEKAALRVDKTITFEDLKLGAESEQDHVSKRQKSKFADFYG